MPSFIGQTVSHYKLLEHLGGGRMGIVFKAYNTELDRDVTHRLRPSLKMMNKSGAALSCINYRDLSSTTLVFKCPNPYGWHN